MALLSCQADTEENIPHRNDKEELKALIDAPLFREKDIKYNPSMRDNHSSFFSYEDWCLLFKEKTIYDIPELGVKNTMQVPDFMKTIPSNMRKEDTAFVLGKVRLDENIYGIIMLEPGYYSITRIFIYPINREGKMWRGLELADWFADENEEIIITSRLQMNKHMEIATKIISKTYKETENLAAADTIKSTKVKEIAWVFDRAYGFMRKQNNPATRSKKTP